MSDHPTLVERNMFTLVQVCVLIVTIPEGLWFGANGLPLKPIHTGLKGPHFVISDR